MRTAIAIALVIVGALGFIVIKKKIDAREGAHVDICVDEISRYSREGASEGSSEGE